MTRQWEYRAVISRSSTSRLKGCFRFPAPRYAQLWPSSASKEMEIKRRHGASEFRRDRSLPPASIAQRLLPILGWLPGYRRDWLLPDVLAGLAVWAVMVPEGMAYAGIVGVPPIMGLYTIVPPLIAYALLGTSRLLVVGPDTATGLISALTVGAIAAQGNCRVQCADLHPGDFDRRLFPTVRRVAHGLGGGLHPDAGHARIYRRPGLRHHHRPSPASAWASRAHPAISSPNSGSLLQHLPDISLAPVLTGLLSLIAMLLLRHLAPRIPAALVVAVVATILVGVLGGEAAGISVVGELPVRPATPRAAPPRPYRTAGACARRARHRAGRLCRGARRGKGRGDAGRRRHRS